MRRVSNSLSLGVPLLEVADELRRLEVEPRIFASSIQVESACGIAEIVVSPPGENALDGARLEAVVTVRSPIANEDIPGIPGLLPAVNRFAALGALTVLDERVRVISRLSTYAGEDAWNLHVPLLACAAVLGSHAVIAGSLDGLVGNQRADRSGSPASNWRAKDFAEVRRWFAGRCACSVGATGFTAEFSLREGSGSAALGDSSTALLKMSSVQPHPILGSGLHAVLELPHQFPDVARLDTIVARLNAWEARPADGVPHYGAWCLGSVSNPAYVCFFPNYCHQPGIALNLAIWMLHRARLADGLLLSLGQI